MSNFAFKRGSVFLEHKSAFSRTSSGVKRDISLEPRAHLSRLNTPSECQSRYQSAPFRLVYADFSNSLHLNLIAFPDKSLYVEIKSFGTRLKHCGSIYCIIASVFGFINRMPIVVANIDNFCTIALRKVFLLFKSNFCVPYIEIPSAESLFASFMQMRGKKRWFDQIPRIPIFYTKLDHFKNKIVFTVSLKTDKNCDVEVSAVTKSNSISEFNGVSRKHFNWK